MVVVQWDQRGTGKSYAALEPVDTLTVDNMVADTIQLTGYLRDRFDEDKLYVLGNSWGTTLGVLAVQQRPDLYHAYIGAGQMVSQRATDVLLYDEMVTWADRNDARLAQTLRRQGAAAVQRRGGLRPAVGQRLAARLPLRLASRVRATVS